jgi:hypothetical protein
MAGTGGGWFGFVTAYPWTICYVATVVTTTLVGLVVGWW